MMYTELVLFRFNDCVKPGNGVLREINSCAVINTERWSRGTKFRYILVIVNSEGGKRFQAVNDIKNNRNI